MKDALRSDYSRSVEERWCIGGDVVQVCPDIKPINHVAGISLPRHPVKTKDQVVTDFKIKTFRWALYAGVRSKAA